MKRIADIIAGIGALIAAFAAAALVVMVPLALLWAVVRVVRFAWTAP